MQTTMSRSPDDAYRATMEVALHTEHDCLPLLDSLLLVTPFAREFYGCLHSFSASVQGQHHVIFEKRS